MIEWMSGHALRAAYAKRSISPIDVVRTLLSRIEQGNLFLEAFLAVDPDSALLQARRAEAALFADGPPGPLHGLPVSIKDTIDTVGLRSTSGSLLRIVDVPTQDAAFERARPWANSRPSGIESICTSGGKR